MRKRINQGILTAKTRDPVRDWRPGVFQASLLHIFLPYEITKMFSR